MNCLTIEQKRDFIQWSIRSLAIRRHPFFLCTHFCIWLIERGTKEGFNGLFIDDIKIVFPELYKEIQLAFKKTNTKNIIGYTWSYRYKGRIRLLHRVSAKLNKGE